MDTHMENQNLIKKIGFLFAVLSSLATAGGLYHEVSKPKASLTAYVNKDIFYTPPQYDNKMAELLNKSDFGNIYDSIDSISKSASFDNKKNLVTKLLEYLRIPFTTPFENGLAEYKKQVFIYVKNDGDAIAKNVYVDYPQKVLLMIEDDKGDYSNEKNLTARYVIPSIRQGGHYRIWAWIKGDSFDEDKIKIGSDDQVAKIEIGQISYGNTGNIIILIQNNIGLIIFGISLCIFLVVFSLSITISHFFEKE